MEYLHDITDIAFSDLKMKDLFKHNGISRIHSPYAKNVVPLY